MFWQMAKQVNNKVPSHTCKSSLAVPGLKLEATSWLLNPFTLFPFFFFLFIFFFLFSFPPPPPRTVPPSLAINAVFLSWLFFFCLLSMQSRSAGKWIVPRDRSRPTEPWGARMAEAPLFLVEAPKWRFSAALTLSSHEQCDGVSHEGNSSPQHGTTHPSLLSPHRNAHKAPMERRPICCVGAHRSVPRPCSPRTQGPFPTASLRDLLLFGCISAFPLPVI